MSDQEPYTRVPNALLDTMADLGNAELRVLLAIVRRTTGFQKACDVISLSQLERQTGIARPHIVTALESLLARNYIERDPATRNGYCYRLVTLGNQSPKVTSNPRLPEPVTLGNQSLVTLGNTQKKEKEKKESIADDAQSAPPPPTKTARTRKPKADPDSPLAVRQALADTCAIEYGRHGPKEPKLQVNTVAGKLWKAAQEKGATEAQVIEGIKTTAAYCRRVVYPYKDGQPLTPGAIHKHWKAAIEERDRTRARGNGAYVNGASAPSALAALSPADVADGAEIARLFRQGGGR